MPRRRSLLSPLDFPCSPPPPQSVLLQKTLQQQQQQQQQQRISSNALKTSILIIAIIITLVFLISTSIHLLLRCLHRLYHSHSQSHSSSLSHPQVHPVVDCHVSSDQLQTQELIDSLPVFSFNSVAQAFQKSAALDCAVCLSRFEPNDQLHLLPSCCHAFHSSCIDAWLLSNRSCPLCRTTVSFYEFSFPTTAHNGEESFRLEIGSLSQRGDRGSDSRRTYSMGSFDYVVDDDLVAQVDVGLSRHRTGVSDCEGSAPSKDKEDAPPPAGADVAEAVGGRGWLKEYVDRLASSASSSLSSSRAISFRLSGRSGGGSSRRNDGTAVAGGGSCDMDNSFSRWLTGA